jgi:hypothetical protein
MSGQKPCVRSCPLPGVALPAYEYGGLPPPPQFAAAKDVQAAGSLFVSKTYESAGVHREGAAGGGL